jgi:predicted nucleic acid-binding protein
MVDKLKIQTVYLDVCALCRPFDDQSFVRVRMESDAVKLILQRIREGQLRLALSPVHYREISAIPDVIERVELLGVINNLGYLIKGDLIGARQRAEVLVQHGFGVADAAHVAFAEAEGADFITCDDRLLKKCQKVKLAIWCGDPLQFCIKGNLK